MPAPSLNNGYNMPARKTAKREPKKAKPADQSDITQRVTAKRYQLIIAKMQGGKPPTAAESKFLDQHNPAGTRREPEQAAAPTEPKHGSNGLIEITESDVIRWGLSRAKVKAVLTKVTPTRANKHQRMYDCGQVVMALMASEENDEDRKKRLDADLAEEKLKRIRGESIDLKMSRDILADIMRMQVEAVKSFPGLNEKARQAMRASATRLLADLGTCRFVEPAEG